MKEDECELLRLARPRVERRTAFSFAALMAPPVSWFVTTTGRIAHAREDS